MMRNNMTALHLSIPQKTRTMICLSVMLMGVFASNTVMAELNIQQGSYKSSPTSAWSAEDVGMLLENDTPAGQVDIAVTRSVPSATNQKPIMLNNSTLENRYPTTSTNSISDVNGATKTVISSSPAYSVSNSSSNHTSTYNQPNVNARAALVMDAQTGEILFGKNTNAVLPIASITKLMTAVVTSDAHLDMAETITLQQADFSCAGCKSSSSTLRVGDRMNRAEALLFALMKSENPAAAALARTYPGGRSTFIAEMNKKAKSLGMNSTHYMESTGLHPGNVSSARDLGILVNVASQYGTIRQFSTTPNYNFNLGQRVLSSNNTNALVRNGGWNINISKTGYINEAGRCVVMHTTLNNRPVAVILLGASTSEARTNDATRLMNWVGQLPKRI